MKQFKITDEDAGKRLDVFLSHALGSEYSRSQIQQAIKQCPTLVNKRSSKSGYRLKAGDEIEFTSPEPKITKAEPENIPLDVIYEDKDVIVVNKPCGMVVHPAAGNYNGTLVNALLFHCKGNLANLGSPLRPGIVHRLDKNTSGVIIAAKTDAAYKGLVEQFKSRSVHKIYIAVVKGKMPLLSGKIELPIARSRKNRKKMAVSVLDKRKKPAITHYKVLNISDNFSKIELSIETGRTHQIRVHMSYLGHPILGDTHYGGPTAVRLMLHAFSLQLKHPVNNKDLSFKTPLPDEFK
ncbi:MAG: RluA family pseudouridine synthase [Candidatus Omnitrophica bacterium]|nr:RluA family pseudouridine synthase [Candidatus Omnitrophota bacterium]